MFIDLYKKLSELKNDKKVICHISNSAGFIFCLLLLANRYVELCPVLSKDDPHPIIISQNDFYRIAERNETPPNFYKNIKYVFERVGQEYIVKNGVIYIKYKYMNDLEMIWSHTLKTNDPSWFGDQRKVDSLNRIYENQYQHSQKKK